MPFVPYKFNDPQSTIGLKDMVLARMTADTASAATYGTIQQVAGAIEATVTPGNADADIQYFDDAEGDVLYPAPEISVKVKLADLPLAIQKLILGNRIDENGVLVRNADDKPDYFALGFKAERTDHKFQYVWLYKCRAKPVTENYATKEGKTINRQVAEVEFVAIKRNYDGNYQAIANPSVGTQDHEMISTVKNNFFNSVYTPVTH